ncbi:hypothetical protein RKD20_003812 [Streptomyces sp. SLBN-8D4]
MCARAHHTPTAASGQSGEAGQRPQHAPQTGGDERHEDAAQQGEHGEAGPSGTAHPAGWTHRARTPRAPAASHQTGGRFS